MVIVITFLTLLALEILGVNKQLARNLQLKLVNALHTIHARLRRIIPQHNEGSLMLVDGMVFLLPLIVLMIVIGILKAFLSIGGSIIASIICMYILIGEYDLKEQDELLIKAHDNCFALLFWFALGGVLTAFVYWLVRNFTFYFKEEFSTKSVALFDKVYYIMNWISVRITGLIYALVGDFYKGFDAWLHAIKNIHQDGVNVLLECGKQATTNNDLQVKLVQRAFFAWIALGIVIALIL